MKHSPKSCWFKKVSSIGKIIKLEFNRLWLESSEETCIIWKLRGFCLYRWWKNWTGVTVKDCAMMWKVVDTPGRLCHGGEVKFFHGASLYVYRRKGGKVMAKKKIRIRLKSVWPQNSRPFCWENCWNSKKIRCWSIGQSHFHWEEYLYGLRAVHKYKDSREQFEMRTHKRLIDTKSNCTNSLICLRV